MRRIEFRAKKVDTEEWVYGVPVPDPTSDRALFIVTLSTPIRSAEDVAQRVVEVYPETIGQYVGIQDTRNVDVYENDEVGHYYFDEAGVLSIAKDVMHYDDNCTYDYGGRCIGYDINGFWGNDFFILGNTHDGVLDTKKAGRI